MRSPLLLLLLPLPLLACDPAEEGATDPLPEPGSEGCPVDDDDADAPALSAGAEAEGYLCPQGDRDRFALDASGGRLVDVQVVVDAPISPLELTWAVWDADGSGEAPLASVEGGAAATGGAPLRRILAAGGGPRVIEIRDLGDDHADDRHAYRLIASAYPDPDGNEPNDTAADAASAGEGYLSYHGDEDWFVASSAAAGGLLTLELTMPAGDTAPMFRVEDEAGEVLAEGAGVPGEETALSELIALEQGGLVRVVVESVDGGVDPDTAYALSLDVSADPDVFEPNDTPDQATALGSLRCAPGWGEWVSQSGYLATAGDSDWFDLELEGCARGILEAEVTFDGALPSGMRPALRMVRAVPDAPCSADQDCQALPMSCEDDLDCALFGNVCLASGDCGGVGFCLPDEETCGAALLSATAPADAPETLRISAPLVDLDRLRLSLADYQARVGSLDQAYTLRARVRLDPDRNEPSDVYTAGAPTSSGAAAQAAAAVDMQILSCVAPGGGGDTGDTGGGDAEQQCCADGSGAGWVEGSIGYAFDQDWYRYDHPCPGEDCMVRVHYAIDGGPVDVFTQVYRGSQLWYDSLAPVDDTGVQGPLEGTFGGLEADDECFYAYQEHGDDYYLAVRDTTYRSGDGEGTWDWSPEQRYRLCVEKIADTCMQPCQEYTDGCGQP